MAPQRDTRLESWQRDVNKPIVAKLNIVRVLLSLATNFNWYLKEFNVKNVFLHNNLEARKHSDLGGNNNSLGIC